ncbi:hypothetical protein [Paracidobacterium acidisoli]|nr:hypothetical protein [Paracidobacterium acidisoli]
MVAVPAALTLHRVRVVPAAVPLLPQPSPYGYTVSLLLFIIPVLVIAFWFLPSEEVKFSRHAFWWTIVLLFPLGALLDFFFAQYFFVFPNAGATLGIGAPALGHSVPVEEYIFYFTGFLAVLLLYIWFDEYWLAAYSVPATAESRITFDRLLHVHPWSLAIAVVLIAAGIAYKKLFSVDPAGLPGYFLFLVLVALLPSGLLLPSARPFINWRALSLTMFLMLLVSLMWEVTLALPYGWWGFQNGQIIGLHVTAWSGLPIEEVFLWVAVTYATVIVYEIVKRWKASGRPLWHAFCGHATGSAAHQ